MTEVEIRPGLRLSASPSLYIESLRALVVADVHWGYAISQRVAGRLLPQWGDDELEARLHACLAHYAPGTLVIAGDIVHTAAGAERARRTLAAIAPHVRVVLIGGNHDRRSALACVPSLDEGGYFFHHGDAKVSIPQSVIEVVGHHHPAASWYDGAGTSIKTPALVEGPRRLILPAFSPWAAGVAWNDQLRDDEKLWLISARRIFALRDRHNKAGHGCGPRPASP